MVLSFIWKQAGRLGTSTPGGEHFARLPPPTLVLADQITKALAQSDPWLRAGKKTCGKNQPTSPPSTAHLCAQKAGQVQLDPGKVAGVLQSVMAPLSNRPAAVDVARMPGCGERQALAHERLHQENARDGVELARLYFDIHACALLAMGNPKASSTM
ncbi:MAG: hypothetical protein U0165_09150 [Polyangiaceae bacterium]